tara:strand:- start:462 stop:1619 length:1158 start_codon:yes stop_codon:yes gene_type:complete
MFNDYFSSNLIALSDDQARIELRGDLLINSYSSYFDGFFDGVHEFTGICLSNPVPLQQKSMIFNNTGLYHPIKIRPMAMHSFIIPDPCAPNISVSIAKLLVSAHPLAFAERPAMAAERVPVFGDVLSFRMGSAPRGSGKIRSIRYSYPSKNHRETYRCVNKFIGKDSVLKSLKFTGFLGTPINTSLSSLSGPNYNYDYWYKYYYEGNLNSDGKMVTKYAIKPAYPRKVSFYERHDDLFRSAAIANGIEPSLLKAISWAENALRDTGCSSAGACGIMQFVKSTAIDEGLVVDSTVDERNDPEKSINAAAKYLKKIYNSRYLKSFSGDVKWAMSIAAYNTGMGNVGKYGKKVLSSGWNCRKNCGETGEYVAKVMAAKDYLLNEQGFK